jgi:hypothetical protein
MNFDPRGQDHGDSQQALVADGALGDQSPSDDRGQVVAEPPEISSGLRSADTHTARAAECDQHGQEPLAPQPAVAVLIALITGTQREVVDHYRASNRVTQQIKARLGRMLGVTLKDPAVDKLFNAMLGKGEHDLAAGALALNAAMLAARSGLLEAHGQLSKQRDTLTKNLLKQMPEAAVFVTETKGLGIGLLAQIIGETGDLSLYATPSRTWKRMGLAVMKNGERQRRFADRELAIEAGYVPRRKAIMWNLSEALIKAQCRTVKDDDGKKTGSRAIGPLGEVYLAEKTRQIEMNELTPAHAHARAKRYIEKRLLRGLWQVWRANVGMSPESAVLAETPPPLAEAAE